LKYSTLPSVLLAMTEQTLAMYCFIDDLLTLCRPAWAPAPNPRQRLSDAEVLTTALVVARYFGGNLGQAQRFNYANYFYFFNRTVRVFTYRFGKVNTRPARPQRGIQNDDQKQ
jgi:hypothetical protein